MRVKLSTKKTTKKSTKEKVSQNKKETRIEYVLNPTEPGYIFTLIKKIELKRAEYKYKIHRTENKLRVIQEKINKFTAIKKLNNAEQAEYEKLLSDRIKTIRVRDLAIGSSNELRLIHRMILEDLEKTTEIEEAAPFLETAKEATNEGVEAFGETLVRKPVKKKKGVCIIENITPPIKKASTKRKK